MYVVAKLLCTKSRVLNLLCDSDAGAWNPAYTSSVGRLVRAAITCCWLCAYRRDANLNLKARLLSSNMNDLR